MNEQDEQRPPELDDWPMPSRDVLRDLDRRAPAWPEPETDAEPAPSRR